MDSLSYRGLTFTILQTLGWEREDLLDPSGTTYECTRYRGSMILAYNPGAASFQSNGLNTPTASAGKMPVDTDNAIRLFMSQPRGLLRIFSAGTLWLESPRLRNGVRDQCDVRNGPFVKVHSVVQIPGERLWRIHFDVETYVNERPVEATTKLPHLMLSNRWYASDTTNWQHLRTRVMQGICTVRGDTLRRQAIPEIDLIRPLFASFTVPTGFQRESVQVSVTPDGNSAHYTVVDVEQLFNKSSNSPAIRIQISDNGWYWTGTAMRMLGQVGGFAGIAARGVAAGSYFASAAASGGLNPSGAALVNLVLETSNLLGAAATNNLPKAYKNVVVRVWGNQRTPRSNLVHYAMSAAIQRIGTPNVFLTSSHEVQISQDSENFVQVSYTLNWGLDVPAAAIGGPGAAAFAAGIFAQPDPAWRLFSQQVLESSTTQVLTPQGMFTHGQGVFRNPAFPSSLGTRGTASLPPSAPVLQLLVSQTLEGFNTSPADVP